MAILTDCEAVYKRYDGKGNLGQIIKLQNDAMPLSASTMIYGCLFDKGSLVLENATLSQLILAINVH